MVADLAMKYDLYDNGGKYYDFALKELYVQGDVTTVAVTDTYAVTRFYNNPPVPRSGKIVNASYDIGNNFTTVVFSEDINIGNDLTNLESQYGVYFKPAAPQDGGSLFGAHAEGFATLAVGEYSHAEGYATYAMETGSHAEGYYTSASGSYSHAEGANTLTAGVGSHAEGINTSAIGIASHAGGYGTVASGSYQTAIGIYNTENNTDSLFVIGGGISDSRKDIFDARVDASGSGSVMIPVNPSDPTNPTTGSMYFNPSTNLLYIYNGTAWKSASFA